MNIFLRHVVAIHICGTFVYAYSSGLDCVDQKKMAFIFEPSNDCGCENTAQLYEFSVITKIFQDTIMSVMSAYLRTVDGCMMLHPSLNFRRANFIAPYRS